VRNLLHLAVFWRLRRRREHERTSRYEPVEHAHSAGNDQDGPPDRGRDLHGRMTRARRLAAIIATPACRSVRSMTLCDASELDVRSLVRPQPPAHRARLLDGAGDHNVPVVDQPAARGCVWRTTAVSRRGRGMQWDEHPRPARQRTQLSDFLSHHLRVDPSVEQLQLRGTDVDKHCGPGYQRRATTRVGAGPSE
jgi:hypothetical protein